MSKSLDCVAGETESELHGRKAFETLNITEPRVRSGKLVEVVDYRLSYHRFH